jgi:hypothetical protein
MVHVVDVVNVKRSEIEYFSHFILFSMKKLAFSGRLAPVAEVPDSRSFLPENFPDGPVSGEAC